MHPGLRADRAYLTSSAYADDRLLHARQSLYDHQRPHVDLVGETVRALGQISGRRVLDVGCGNGAYHSALETAGAVLVGLDLSRGMLQSLAGPISGKLVADAQALPLASACVDAVLAMHMLYHVPDPVVAVDEFARVLRRPGRLVASVGGAHHLVEAQEMWASLLAEVGLDSKDGDLGLINNRLPADRLEQILTERFDHVVFRTLTSQVVLDTPEPIVRHAASTTAAKEAHRLGADLIARFQDLVASTINRDGLLHVTTEVAWFSATNAAP
ncbi:MAG: class I SAM-dependent methyltransferase [Acidimicrobiaceae bacterium]|nr:class I SAM-dependent methyltransferase [Acidimicrobiaceae bacterium]